MKTLSILAVLVIAAVSGAQGNSGHKNSPKSNNGHHYAKGHSVGRPQTIHRPKPAPVRWTKSRQRRAIELRITSLQRQVREVKRNDSLTEYEQNRRIRHLQALIADLRRQAQRL